MQKAKGYLSLARKAGLLETGEENCGIAVRNGKAKLLVVAGDASENALRRAKGYLTDRKIPMLHAPFTKLELMEATGKNGCSMLAFTEIGFAEGFISALAELEPEKYQEIKAQLASKRERATERRQRGKKAAEGESRLYKNRKGRTIE